MPPQAPPPELQDSLLPMPQSSSALQQPLVEMPFKFFSWNVRHSGENVILTHLDALMGNTPLHCDVIALQETGWGWTELPDGIAKLCNEHDYECVHQRRHRDHTYGGAALLVNRCWKPNKKVLAHVSADDGKSPWRNALEVAAMEVTINDQSEPIQFFSVYVHHTAAVNIFSEFVASLPRNGNAVVMGDFNAALSDVGSRHPTKLFRERGDVIAKLIETDAWIRAESSRPTTGTNNYIDHLLLSAKAAAVLKIPDNVVPVIKDEAWRSDHRPMVDNSQFGFVRGMPAAVPLVGLSMFIQQGLRQKTSMQYHSGPGARRHATLLVCIDGVDAFCRANGVLAVQALKDLGINQEAYWVGRFLQDRKLCVKVGDAISDAVDLDRGVPQGTILGPLIWSLVVNSLLKKLDEECNKKPKKTMAVPLTYADDINFAVQAYDPAAAIKRANKLLEIVHDWSKESGVPMGKLQSTWINGGHKNDWAGQWTAADGELICGDPRDRRCLRDVPSTQSRDAETSERTARLLGVLYSQSHRFGDHVRMVANKVGRQLGFMASLCSTCPAAKLRVVYDSMALSTMLYAAEAWWPYLREEHKQKLERLHAKACRIILGVPQKLCPNSLSVVREAGYRSLNHIVQERLVKLAERLKRMPTPFDRIGTGWVVKMYTSNKLPTLKTPHGRSRKFENAKAGDGVPVTVRTLPDILKGEDTLPDALPYFKSVDRLCALDKAVPPSAFIISPPGGLTKNPDLPEAEKQQHERQLFEANDERMASLTRNALFIYTDGAYDHDPEQEETKVAGGFVVFKGPETEDANWLDEGPASFGDIGCSYTAEIRTIHAALRWLDGRPRPIQRVHVNLVTDSLSSLMALGKGPLRQTSFIEQQCWERLAVLSMWYDFTFAFVFSHHGVEGNVIADNIASLALEDGPDDEIRVWRTDAVRLRIQDLREKFDKRVTAQLRIQKAACYGTKVPTHLKLGFTRRDERLLFNARVGIVFWTAGATHETDAPCPRCGAAGVMGRGGKSIAHVFGGCNRERTALKAKALWNSPMEALAQLRRFVPLSTANNQQQKEQLSQQQQQTIVTANVQSPRQQQQQQPQPHGTWVTGSGSQGALNYQQHSQHGQQFATTAAGVGSSYQGQPRRSQQPHFSETGGAFGFL